MRFQLAVVLMMALAVFTLSLPIAAETPTVVAKGTWIGTAGSWSDKGDVGAKAFDGNLATFVDAPSGSGGWTGLDLRMPRQIVGLRFAPRLSWASRMVGGVFEGANARDFSDAVTLHKITVAPPEGVMTDVALGTAAGLYRYVRYVSPVDGYCNVSEIAFLVPDVHLDGPAAPTLSVPPGFSPTNVTVALAYPVDGAEIYYTLDGSMPMAAESETCFRYTAPLVFGDVTSRPNRLALIPTNPYEFYTSGSYKDQYGWAAPKTDPANVNVLRARAFKNGVSCTNEVAGTWLVGSIPNAHTLRVVSIQADEADFFSNATGLMVPGDVYKSYGRTVSGIGEPYANYFQHGDAWEREVAFELFETNRVEVVAQHLGVRMHGGYSRACAQKTMTLYARKEYGKKKVTYQLFGDDPETDFRRFLLRNGGNDWYQTGFRDAFGQSLFRGWVTCDTQGYEPCVVYLNGEYWGIQNFRHHYSKHFFETWHGADPENLDFIKTGRAAGDDVQEGDGVAYAELCSYLNSHDLASDAAAWAYVQTRIDIANLVDYNILHTYLVNTDWPDNNQGFWRERVDYSPTAAPPHDGRWRFVSYDTDHGLGLSGSVTTDMISYAKKHAFFKALSANPEFIRRFASRYADLLNTALAPVRTTNRLACAAARLRGEMPRHIARWTRQGSLATWENHLQTVNTFLLNREAQVRANLNSYFAVGESVALTVNTNGAGRIQVNSISSGPGEGEFALPFTGRYFTKVPVTLTATPEPGWRFIAWIVGEETILEPTISLTLSKATSLTAYFVPVPRPQIVVNEVMANADVPDWFELFNAGTEEVHLGGCWLTDDSLSHLTAIPPETRLSPGGYLLVEADDTVAAGLDANGILHVPFGLGKNGDAVNLWNPARTERLAQIVFGVQAKNVSEGCWPNGTAGTWRMQSVPTPGRPNRSPAATGAWLPDGVSTNVLAGEEVVLSCAVTNAAAVAGVYALVESSERTATISQAGVFTWRVPAFAAPGVRAFRVGWSAAGEKGDETTLLVTVTRPVNWEELIPHVPTVACAGTTRCGATPLVYWAASPHAESYTIERAVTLSGAYAPVGTVGKGRSVFLDRTANTATNWYRIVANAKTGLTTTTLAGQAWASGLRHTYSGDILGTAGSWSGKGDVKEHLFDGNTSTFFDAPEASGWGGIDVGNVCVRAIEEIRYWPRNDWSARMVGQRFQVAQELTADADFANPLTIHTIPSEPPQKTWTTVTLANTNAWRAIRYIATSGNCNANEIEFRGQDVVPSAPLALRIAAHEPTASQVAWNAVTPSFGYLVFTNGVLKAFTTVPVVTVGRSRTQMTVGVAAVNGNGMSEMRTFVLPAAALVLLVR